MITIPEPVARVTEYTVSCLPQDHELALHLSLLVVERSLGRWAVLRNGFCYNAAGEKEYERSGTDRTPEFLEKFRHSRKAALALAKRIAPTLTVNGVTVNDALTEVTA
jgi:hypothetical protein